MSSLGERKKGCPCLVLEKRKKELSTLSLRQGEKFARAWSKKGKEIAYVLSKRWEKKG